MPQTSSRYDALLQHTDATLYVPATVSDVYSGTATQAKVAVGDYAISVGNSQVLVLAFNLPAPIRTGEYPLELTGSFEQYNQPLHPATVPYSVPGIQTNRPVNVVKSLTVTSIDYIYQVTGAALTLNQTGIFTKQDVANQAATFVTLAPLAANGMPTAVQATRYVVRVPVPAAGQVQITSPDTVLSTEWQITTPAGGTATVFGVVFNYSFNCN